MISKTDASLRKLCHLGVFLNTLTATDVSKWCMKQLSVINLQNVHGSVLVSIRDNRNKRF